MRNSQPWTRTLAATALLGLVAGCSSEPDSGRLSLSVTDAAVDDATSVFVQFTGVEIKPQDGPALDFDFDEPRNIDLLALNGGGSELLLDDVTVPGGRYNWVRLKVNAEDDGVLDSYLVTNDGGEHELEIPSGAETGLKLVSGFVVPAGQHARFTLDFDLRKSVHQPMDEADSYKLRPVLRIVDNAEVGAIAGTVDSSLVVEGCSPAVYVFDGAGTTPDDIDGINPDPVTSSVVKLDTDSGNHGYRAAFLAPGAYTVAFTCEAGSDDPATDDTIAFGPAQDATVATDADTEVNFGP